MRHKIGDSVQIKSTGNLKKIIDCEVINMQEIYYMSDKTSYHLSEISDMEVISFDELKKGICGNTRLIEETTKDYAKEMAKKTIKWFLY